MGKRSGWAVAGCAMGLYGASLLLPTAAPFNPDFSDTTYPGYVAFRAWKVLLEWAPGDVDWWVLGLAWLANPATWAAVALAAVGRRRAAGLVAACAVVLGLVALPRYFFVVAGLPGYWAWVGSPGLVLAASLAPWHWLAAEPGVAPDRRPASPPRDV